jgi:hypothetical protein
MRQVNTPDAQQITDVQGRLSAALGYDDSFWAMWETFKERLENGTHSLLMN